MAEEAKKERVIKNASLEEIEKLKKENSIPTFTETEIKEKETIEEKEKETIEEKDSEMLKKKANVFEPDPVLFKLPSGNKFVNKNLTSKNEIYVRRMGSYEEGLFYKLIGNSTHESINATMDVVIDSCVKSNINIYDLSLIDKMAIFFKIIHLTYGKLDLQITCAGKCSETNEVKLDLDKDLEILYVPEKQEYPKKIKLTSYKQISSSIVWYLKYFTIHNGQHFYQSNIDNIDVMLMLTDKIEGTIIENDKERNINQKDYDGILRFLNDDDRESYRVFLNDFGKFGAQTQITKKVCKNPNCDCFNKDQTFEIPVEQIFQRVVKIQK